MVFSSIEFLCLFFGFVLILYYNPIFKSRKYKNLILLFMSFCFYAWNEPIYIFAMLVMIFINWILGLKIAKTGSNKLLVTALIIDIGNLFVFKYLGFSAQIIGSLINKDFHIQIPLPIGISFFTFQIISYIIDVYRKKVKGQENLLYLGLYSMMFPQLAAGPIVRYEDIANEIENRRENFEDFSDGIFRFIYGLGKKILIANNVAIVADAAFSLEKKSALTAWIGAIAYTVQIYCDFSGYSDMAIGLGKMFGFHFKENFNYPYIASSVTDFWRRWHISLSQWFRDYVYIPLGGSRVSVSRYIFNMFVVWTLTGIWHGANWTFVLWGIIFFIVLTIEKNVKLKIPNPIGHIYTMTVFVLSWVLFRSDSVLSAFEYIKTMFGYYSIIDDVAISLIQSYKVFIVLGIAVCFPVKNIFSILKIDGNSGLLRLMNLLWIMFLLITCIAALLSDSYKPFIYFNF